MLKCSVMRQFIEYSVRFTFFPFYLTPSPKLITCSVYTVHQTLYFTGTGDALKLMAELLRIFIAGTCKLKLIYSFIKNCLNIVLYETAKTMSHVGVTCYM